MATDTPTVKCQPCGGTFTVHVRNNDGTVDCPTCRRRYWPSNLWRDIEEGVGVFQLRQVEGRS